MHAGAPLHVLGSVPAALAWLAGRGARALASDSRAVQPGCAFIAWPGAAQDGRRFVHQALDAGAVACVVEADGAEAFELCGDDRVASMVGLKANAGPLVSAFLGSPSDRLKVVATTGTNGKTSTAWWTAQALAALGRRCGFIGTLGVGDPPVAAEPGKPAEPAHIDATGLTTPDPVTLQTAFKRFADEAYAGCAIEASSIGIAEKRLSGTHIDVALFTNFTLDHLDYHGSMDAYWQAKLELFSWPGLRAAVVNIDDAKGAELAQRLASQVPDVWTYSVRAESGARLVARDIGYPAGGLGFELGEGEQAAPVRTGLIGGYNVSNLLAVIGGLRALGVALPDAAQVCSALTPVPGRMQRVDAGAGPNAVMPEVIVDYAHTPDALEQALGALQPLAAERGGALWCVFGCGGNRDAGKRPLMGALAQRLAQHVVVTSDNPRHEAPEAILRDIAAGMAAEPVATVIEDRRAAIAHAVSQCGEHDVILIAGKGHEDYQDVAGVKHPFDDVVEAQTALLCRADDGVIT